LNKADEADKEMLELVELEIRELLKEFGYDGDETPVIAGSALCALEAIKPEIGRDAIVKLLKTVDDYIPQPKRDLEKPTFFPIERSYMIKGRGTVATGKLERGTVKKGDTLEGIGRGADWKTTVTGVEMFRKTVDKAEAGDQLGLLLRGVDRESSKRGIVLVPQGSGIQAKDRFEAKVYMLKPLEGGQDKPMANYYISTVYSLTWDATAWVQVEGKDLVMPGEDTSMTINLNCPMYLETGQRFTFRQMGKTVATGVVTKLLDNQAEDMKGLKSRRKLMLAEVEKLGFNPYGDTLERRVRKSKDGAPTDEKEKAKKQAKK